MVDEPIDELRIKSARNDVERPFGLRDSWTRRRGLRHLQQVAQLRSFCLEIFGIMRIGLGPDRYLLDHFEAVSLEPDNFLRVICQESELSHAEVEKNLRAQAVVAQVAGISQLRVGLHSIETFLL